VTTPLGDIHEERPTPEEPAAQGNRDLAGHEIPEGVSGDEGLGAGDPESLAPHEKIPPDSPKKPSAGT
jgi:hypothetical protein